MAEWLGVEPTHFLSLYQVHSPDVLHVTGPWPAERPKADGMVTATPGLALAVGSADCGPILFADPQAKIVGACHSGWKGAIGGVLESTSTRWSALVRIARASRSLGADAEPAELRGRPGIPRDLPEA